MKRLEDAGALLGRLGPGCTVVLHSGCAEPAGLAGLLARHADSMKGVRVLTMMPMGDSPYAAPGPAASLQVQTFFPGRGLRAAINDGRATPLRHTLGALPGLFGRGQIRADVLMLQVSPPDETGHVSLGVSVDYMRAVLAQSPMVIAEVNPRMPRTCGDTRVPVWAIDAFIDATQAPQAIAPAQADEVDQRIARHVAALVRDGAVLQVGIGSLPDAVLGQLGHLRHLGLHTGIVTDAVRPLIESGAIDNSTKKLKPGVSVTTMAGGTQAFYDFLHDNAALEFHPCSFTHAPDTLSALDGLCAINSALQVDLRGRVNAETVNGRAVSMAGGLSDFACGAVRARGGLSLVALRSTFGRDAASTVVPALDDILPPTLQAAQVDFVVTENGTARLRGASPLERARGLIAVADPRHREALERALAHTPLEDEA